jgi:hypothetical protein
MMLRGMALALVAFLCLQDPKEKLKQQLKDPCDASWVYDDLAAGFAQAKKTGKPLMIVFR